MDEIWGAFAQAVVTLELQSGPAVLRPDEVGQVGRFPFEEAVHIVTAYNPGGELADDSAVGADGETQNEQRHRQLEARLSGHERIASVGSATDGSFAEPGFAVHGIGLDTAVALGREFAQRAIYQWTKERLLIVGVDEPVEIELGWALGNRGIVIPAL